MDRSAEQLSNHSSKLGEMVEKSARRALPYLDKRELNDRFVFL